MATVLTRRGYPLLQPRQGVLEQRPDIGERRPRVVVVVAQAMLVITAGGTPIHHLPDHFHRRPAVMNTAGYFTRGPEHRAVDAPGLVLVAALPVVGPIPDGGGAEDGRGADDDCPIQIGGRNRLAGCDVEGQRVGTRGDVVDDEPSHAFRPEDSRSAAVDLELDGD